MNPLSRIVTSTAAKLAALTVGAIVGGGAAVLLTVPGTPADVMDTRPGLDVTAPADLVAADADCWTGEAPADMVGVVPGRVVTQDGYGAAKMVEKALEQLPPSMGGPGVDHGLVIYGFCR